MKLLIFLVALAIGAVAFADDEQLHQQIFLTATTSAPASTAGKATLQAESAYGVTTAGIAVEVKGLAPGTYSVSATKKSDGSVLNLGTFAVSVFSNSTDCAAGHSGDDEVAIEFGTEEGLPLPDDLAPMDIAGLSVADAGKQTVLTGSFTDAGETMKALFKANVAVAGSDGAIGTAQIRTRTRFGFKTERFKLNVKGVTPNATLALKINGEDFGTVTTDSHGKLRLNSLPEGVEPESIILMEFADPDGTNALTISF